MICAYTVDRWSDIRCAMTSALAQEPPPMEVVLVVDHNEVLRSRASSLWPEQQSSLDGGTRVRVVASQGQRGLSGARNTGVQVSSGEVVAFLDDDAVADAGWLATLMAPYEDQRVVACGGAAIPALDRPRPVWWPTEFDWVVGCSYLGMPTTTADVRNLIGANMSIRRLAVAEAGGFNEGMGRVGTRPSGCEETELFIRLSQRLPDARIVYEPCATVRHRVPDVRLTWRYFRSRCWAEGHSKAQVATEVGQADALATERTYTLGVLPRGILRGLLGACRGERGAGRRALAIAAGLAITSAGYLSGRVTQRVTSVSRNSWP